MYHHNHNQRRSHYGQRHEGHQDNRPATSRKLALENPLLAVKVALEPQQQDQDADAEKRRAQRPAQTPQRIRRVLAVAQRGVEPEELGDGDANRGKRERCAQPGKKRSL